MINVNQQVLLELLKVSLFGTEPVFPEGVDWDDVLQEAKDQTAVALAAPAVPEEKAEKPELSDDVIKAEVSAWLEKNARSIIKEIVLEQLASLSGKNDD